MGLTVFLLALAIMAQWVVLLVLTNLILSPWGMLLGVAVLAAQMLAMFDRRRDAAGAACPIPERGESGETP